MATEAQRRAVRKYEQANDRINIVLPAGTRARIESLNLGKSFSAFVREAVLGKLEQLENKDEEK